MSKILEIIESKVSFLGEEDCQWVTEAMKEYAEWYARECLKIAANNGEITCGSTNKSYKSGFCTGFCEGGGCEYAVIKLESITNLTLPEHD